MHAIINGRIVLNDKILDGCALLFDKIITGIVSRETLDAAWQKEKSWQEKPLTLTDACGAYVSPGFINLHIHGCAGADTMDAKEDTLAAMSRFLVQTGVTAFLPTTMTCEMPAVYNALERVRGTMTVITRRRDEKLLAGRAPVTETETPATVPVRNLREDSFTVPSGLSDDKAVKGKNFLPGAKVLGAYLEGPFISSAYKGAQKKEHIIPADFTLIKDFTDVVKVVVLAPETLGQAEKVKNFIAQCNACNIIVSLGHSAADYDTAWQAIEAGASHVTHLCNAMTGLHHRNPGLLGAALDTEVTCELVADNLHVHPAVQRLVYRTKGAAGIELVTDSMRACGLPDGISELGGQTVFVKNGAARLADGTIAGSVVTMNRALKNFRENTGATVPEVVRMVTENQAQELGLFEKIGSLSPGATADITIFDEGFSILHTFVDGLEVYKNPAIR
jgi:N-acetylglucosamine-6-phosphate deacetylase